MMVKMCPKCRSNKMETDEPFGAYFPFVNNDDYVCRNCSGKLVNIDIDFYDYNVIVSEKNTIEFLEAMLKFKEINLIEYQSKISEFRNRQTWRNKSNKPKCPHCSSTNIAPISGTERAGSILMWGIFSKKINKSFKCKNCGYTW